MTIDIFDSGSGNWTVPTGITSVTIKLWGGGGGGAGGGDAGGGAGASGGGAGGYCEKTLSVTPGNTIAYVVGAGGAHGLTGDGTNGNEDGASGTASSVSGGAYIAYGGDGAIFGESGTTSGGTASGGDTNTTGGVGAAKSGNSGGAGGNSPNGGTGGTGGVSPSTGGNGGAPGGGGGGGPKLYNGGNGAAGRVSFTYSGAPTSFTYTSTGGLILGGSSTATMSMSFTYTSTGGLILGGSAVVPIPIVISTSGGPAFGGGAVVEFLAAYPICQMTNCGCSDLHFDVKGGASFGGGGTAIWNQTSGVKMGGWSKNRISTYGFDGLNFLIPLSTKVPVEIVQGLDLLETKTTLVPGIFCLPATQFSSIDKANIYCEKDTLKANQAFAISFWCIHQSKFVQRALFVRGFNQQPTVNKWSLKISYGAFDNLIVSCLDSDGIYYESVSSTKLSKTRWNHVAVSYTSQLISYYLNGVLEGTIAISGTMPVSNGNSIAVHEKSSFPDVKMQEIRCYNSDKSAEYFLAEKNNFCDYDNFLELGIEESPVLS